MIQNLLSSGKAWPAATGSIRRLLAQMAAPTPSWPLRSPIAWTAPSSSSIRTSTANNLLTGRYYIGDSDQSFPLALTGGGLLPGYNTAVPTRVQLVSISYVSTVNPSIVNEARLGWNRFAEGFFPEDRSFDPSSIGLDTVGVGTANNNNPYNFGLPVFNVSSPTGSSLAQLGADKADPRQRVDSNWHYIDNISWKARTPRHQVRLRIPPHHHLANLQSRIPRTPALRFAAPISSAACRTTAASRAPAKRTATRSRIRTPGMCRTASASSATSPSTSACATTTSAWCRRSTACSTTSIPPPASRSPSGKDACISRTGTIGHRASAWPGICPDEGKTVIRAGYGIFYDAVSQDMFLGHLPFSSSFDPGPAYAGNGANPVSFGAPTGLALTDGVPVFSGYSPMTDAFGFDPNIRTPYIQNFNLNLQHELSRHSVVQMGYVGSTGHKLWQFRDINQPGQAAITAADLGCACINDAGVPRVLTGGAFSYVYWEESSANSAYNSLAGQLANQRLARPDFDA